MSRFISVMVALVCMPLCGTALAQGADARELLQQSFAAMGDSAQLSRIRTLTMTGFGQDLNQEGGSNPSPDPRAPLKWQAVHAAERVFDLESGHLRMTDRRNLLFPFAGASGMNWDEAVRVVGGGAALVNPLAALRMALDPAATLGPVSVADGSNVVQFRLASGETLRLALDMQTHLPTRLHWSGPSAALGELNYTAHFTGYLPFDGVRLPVGLTVAHDWRDLTISSLHIDGYAFDTADPVPAPATRREGEGGGPVVEVTALAAGVWDVRVGGNGSAIVEFADRLVMFEAYGSEAATLARIDRANQLVPGKAVTQVIVSHHHFDHTGGLRAAVARGLEVIAERGNEQIFREMIARPAPNYPDALARNPQPLKFLPVDGHLVLEDGSRRLDVFHALGHPHMAHGVVAWLPTERIFIEGDFSTWNWDYHWWGDAYAATVGAWGLEPEINYPVHGRVGSYADVRESVREQAARAAEFCARLEAVNTVQAGCPVRYTGD